jgi:bacterioferritin
MAEKIDREAVLKVLNRILELELAGVVRYCHYSFMVFGPGRLPIVEWLRMQSTSSLTHAQEVGEWITTLGGHPSLTIGPLLETHQHEISNILEESLEHEKVGLQMLHDLNQLVAGKHVGLEEFARAQIVEEEHHTSEFEKMLRSPGDLSPRR